MYLIFPSLTGWLALVVPTVEDWSVCRNNDLQRHHCLLLQLSHSLDSLLNRCHLVQTMAIVKINGGDAEALQTLLARLPHILGISPND